MDNRSKPLARASAVATELASVQRSPRPSRGRSLSGSWPPRQERQANTVGGTSSSCVVEAGTVATRPSRPGSVPQPGRIVRNCQLRPRRSTVSRAGWYGAVTAAGSSWGRWIRSVTARNKSERSRYCAVFIVHGRAVMSCSSAPSQMRASTTTMADANSGDRQYGDTSMTSGGCCGWNRTFLVRSPWTS